MGDYLFSRGRIWWAIAALVLLASGTGMLVYQARQVDPSSSRILNETGVAPSTTVACSIPRHEVEECFKEEGGTTPAEHAEGSLGGGDFQPAYMPKSFEGANILTHRILPARDQVHLRREYIIESDFVYPHLKIVEELSQPGREGKEQLLDQKVMVADHMIVRLKDGVPETELARLNEKYGTRIRNKMLAPQTYIVQCAQIDLDALDRVMAAFSREVSVVAYAEPDYIMFASEAIPDDYLFGYQSSLNDPLSDHDMDCPEAWDISTGSEDVIIGMIDSGIDFDHPDLAPNIWQNKGEMGLDGSDQDKRSNGVDDDGNGFVDDWRGWDFIDNDNDPTDEYWHGTHTAGIAGSAGNNGIGVAGVVWKCKLMPLRMIGSQGAAAGSLAVNAIYYGTPFGMKVTCNSYDGGGYQQSIYDAIEYANQSNQLFVCAAGNDGRDIDTTLPDYYPPRYTNENLIAVLATDGGGNKWGVSSYGATNIDIGARGYFVYSTVPGGEYNWAWGSSFATPHVVGAAALLWSIAPDATAIEVRDALYAGVDHLTSLEGTCATEGRVNAFHAIPYLGLRIARSEPAKNEVDSTSQRKDFVLHFSEPYSVGTIHPSDLRVNGIGANSFTIVDANTVSFHFNSSPVTVEGMQTLAVASNLVTRVSDGEGNHPWTSTYRYDALPLAVVGTSPTDQSTVSLPLTQITLDFNEPVDASTVRIDDLVLSAGTVVHAQVLDADTVRYTVSGIENEALLSVDLPAGALQDVNGAPSLAYTATYQLDVATIALVEPLKEAPPIGSHVYTSLVRAEIAGVTDIDSYTLGLDGGELLTVVATAEASLKSRVELWSPANVLLASASAAAAGEDVVLPWVPTAASGPYTIRARSVGSQSGGRYELSVMVNSAEESEEHGGPSNDELPGAQDLDPGFMLSNGDASRSAVRGTLYPPEGKPMLSENFESGVLGSEWSTYSSNDTGHIRITDIYGAAEGYEALIMDRHVEDLTNIVNAAMWTVDLSGLTNAYLRFKNATWNDERFQGYGSHEGQYLFDGVALSEDGQTWYPMWSGTKQREGEWVQYVIDIVDFATTSGLALGPNMQIKFAQTDDMSIPLDGMGWDDIAITVPLDDKDLYRFTLEAGQVTTLALENRDGGSLTVQLLDSGGALLATGVSGVHNVASCIKDYLAPADGVYYARVTGDAAYALVVTRGAAFDVEPNNVPSMAVSVDATGMAIGHLDEMVPPITTETEPNDDGEFDALVADLLVANDLSGSFSPMGDSFYAEVTGTIDGRFDLDWDFYKIYAAPGDVLDVHMCGYSCGGTLNDPYLRLYDRHATLLAEVDAGGALHLVYTNFVYGGEYYINADADSVWTGTYTLQVSNRTEALAGPDNADTYQMAFSSGDRILVETTTPAVAPHSLGNSLDPMIEVYDPMGTLVASNDNGAPDGRNALLVHQASSTGEYAFRVRTVSGGGPYVLSVAMEQILLDLPQDAGETDGLVVDGGRLSVEYAPSANLTVNLSSDDASELTVDSSVTILAGQTSATFNITFHDDAVLDGTKIVRITGIAAGYNSTIADVAVHDSEVTSLVLLIPSSASEGDGVLTGQGRVNVANPAQDTIELALRSHDTTEVILPATVVLTPGQTTAVFNVTIVDDQELDGPQSVSVSTVVSNWVNDSAAILVADNEIPTLVLNLPSTVVEGDGVVVDAGSVSLDGTLGTDLTIQLQSSDTSELTVPTSVILSAGYTSVPFDITVVDDATVDGAQIANVSAAATAFTGGSALVTIVDNEVHHLHVDPIGGGQMRGQPFAVTVSARSVDNQIILNYAATSSLFAVGDKGTYLPISPSSGAVFSAGAWAGSVAIHDVDSTVRLMLADGSGNSGESNPFDVGGAICVIDPVHFSNTLVRFGRARTRVLTIRNPGSEPLNYNITAPVLTAEVFRAAGAVTDDSDRSSRIDAGDMDGDGTPDVVGVDYFMNTVSWWKPTAPGVVPWQKHIIATNFLAPTSVRVADVDDDGDMDVLATSQIQDDLVWWENNDGLGQNWSRHDISVDYDDPRSVRAADIDDDGDLDVVASAWYGDRVDWWENMGGAGTSWVQHTVETNFNYANNVDVSDIDHDGDLDIAGSSSAPYQTAWWENDDGSGSTWTKHLIDTNLTGVTTVHIADMDGDNDGDVVIAIVTYPLTGGAYWHENLDGAGTIWTQHTLAAYWPQVEEVSTDDLDGDGHPDILAGNFRWPGWWFNPDGTGTNLARGYSTYRYVGAMRAGDFDGDGDQDIIAGSYSNGIAILKNSRILDWIHMDEWSGTVSAGSETNISVLFDGSTFATGAYEQITLALACNDVVSPSNQILMQLEILDGLPPPVLQTEPAYTIGDSNRIAWNAPLEATQYWVELFADTNLPASANSGWIATTDHTFMGLDDGITYYYRAKAGMTTPSGLVESVWSPWVSSLQLHDTGDYDSDGIASAWEVQRGLDPLDPTDSAWDLDGDGLDTRGEYMADTDPFDLDSSLEILSVQSALGSVSVEWRGGVESWQVLLYKADLFDEAWMPLYTNHPPTSVTNLLQYNTDVDVGYYRVRTTRQP